MTNKDQNNRGGSQPPQDFFFDLDAMLETQSAQWHDTACGTDNEDQYDTVYTDDEGEE